MNAARYAFYRRVGESVGKPNNYADLLNQIENGTIKIPQFQRVYGTVTGPPTPVREVADGFALVRVEPMTGIEPAYLAWEVGSVCS